MLMELAQPLDVDRAVIHPDRLTDPGRLPEAKEGLVDQVKYVAHFPKVHFLPVTLSGHAAQTNSLGLQSSPLGSIGRDAYRIPPTGSAHGQPMVAVSENSLRTLEICCCSSPFELGRSS